MLSDGGRRVKKPKIVKALRAGPEHQVLTVVGGQGLYMRRPCDTCPWRKDAVGKFPAEAFRHSAETAYDMATRTFACHTSGAKHPAICAGFLLHGSAHNLAVRIKLSHEVIDLDEVTDGGVELFTSYREMAEANGLAPDDPTLGPCRGND